MIKLEYHYTESRYLPHKKVVIWRRHFLPVYVHETFVCMLYFCLSPIGISQRISAYGKIAIQSRTKRICIHRQFSNLPSSLFSWKQCCFPVPHPLEVWESIYSVTSNAPESLLCLRRSALAGFVQRLVPGHPAWLCVVHLHAGVALPGNEGRGQPPQLSSGGERSNNHIPPSFHHILSLPKECVMIGQPNHFF